MSMRASALAPLLGLWILFAPPRVSAAAAERRGFWLGLGGGVGAADASCESCDPGGAPELGTAAYLKLGGTLSPRWLLGGEVNLWTKEQAGVALNFYSAVATATFYPRASSGFFLKGGAGLAFVDTDFVEGDTQVTLDLGDGPGFVLGLGYDVKVRGFSITPAVNFWYGAVGDLRVGLELVQRNYNFNVIDVTIGITFH
jgi:hypothetical protein